MKSIKGRNNRTIEFSNRFNQQLNAAPDAIKAAFRDTLSLFVIDPLYPALRNHALQRKLAGYHSIDITGDWRAVYREATAGTRTTIVFHQIGTHSKLYKK